MKFRALRYTLLLVALFSITLLLRASLPTVATGTWVAAGNLSAARSGACTVALGDGRLLISGGADANGPTGTADLFSTTGSWSAVASMTAPRAHQSCAVLPNGHVLAAGGTTSGGGITNSVEIYDPSSDSWTQAGVMNDARSGATASVLQDGRVLIAGGQSSGGAVNTIEIFDPNSGNFSNAGTMSSPRQDHAAAVLSDGRVLIIGGSSDGANALATTDIYDPQAGSVSAGPAMSTPRARHTATTLLDGTVVVIGGSDYTNDLASAEFFDPVANNFNAASSLATARSKHSAFLLPNNNEVLVVGGQSAGADLASAELYIPWQKAFQATGAMATPRSDATGAALTKANGRLLIAGGSTASAELYGFATVKTDAADYPPGTTVNITGTGWQPGETVTLTLVESPLIDTHGPYPVVADAFGNISDSSFTTDSHDVNVRFSLTAVGAASNWQAQNTFTDSTNVQTVTTLNAISTPLVTGQPNVSFSGVVSLKTPPTPAIPAGGLVQLQQFLNAGCTGNPNAIQGTATINASGNYSGTFTAPTPATTTTYYYQAQYQGDSQGSGGTATNWLKSTSACQTITVNATVSTTTTVSSSPNPSTYGQSVTFTAAVSPNSGTTIPTGSVAFVIDGASPVAGTPSTCPVSAPANSLCATYTTSALTVNGGTAHSVQANYTHNGNFVDSNGTLSGGQTVNKAALIITAGSYSGVYDGSSHSLSDCSVSANFDNLTCTNSPVGPVGPDFGSGIVTPVVSGSTGNYSVTTNNGAWSITALGVSLTAGSYGPAAYDGSTHALSACTSSNSTFVTCTNSPAGPVGPDFGSGAVSPTPVYGKGIAADYSITPTNGSWSITALTVTVSGGSYSGVYDGNTHALSACTSSYAGVTCANNPVGPVGADVGGAAVAPVSAIATGIPADYTIKPVNGAWSITALGVSLTAGSYGPAAYDGSTHAPSACSSSASTFVTCTNSPSPVGPDFGSGAVSPTPVYGKGIAADYSITPTNGAWSITALTVTVTGGSYSGVYDGNTHALSACASTYAGVSCVNNPVGPIGADVGGAAVAPVATLVSGIAADYNIMPKSGAWSITALGVSLTAGSYGPAAYDGGTHAPSACSSSASTFVTCTNSPSPVGPDFGSGAVSPTPVYGKGIAADYSITPTNGSWSITALTVTVTGGSYSGVYDGSSHPLSACASTYAGVTCTNNPAGPVGADVGGAAVAPVATLVSGIAADYNITPKNGAWSITPLGVTLTAGSYGPVAYDGSTHAPSACSSSASTFVTCTNSPSPVGPDFGSGAVSPTPVYGKGNSTDYSLTSNNGSWSITALTVTVTGGSYSGVYDGSSHPLSACASTYAGVTCTNNPAGPVGADVGGAAVAPVASLASGIAADYDIKPVNGSWSITPLGVTLTAGSYGPAAYDGSTHAPSACSSSASTFVTCTNSPSPVGPDFGSGAVSPTPVYGKGIAADYSITPTNGSWSITALTVTVTGGSYSGVYDGSSHPLSACASTYAGVTCTNNPAGPVGADVGGAAVAPVATLVSGIAADYNITPKNGAWSITPLGVTLTAGSYGPAAYDGSTHAPSACSSSASTFVTCTNSPSPVGPDFGSGAVSPTPVYGKGNSTDYSLTSNNGSWSITALTVTVTGGSYSGVYDGSSHPLSACASTYAGVTCTNNPAGPVGANVGGAQVVPVASLASGIAADYDIKPVNGSWSITQAPSTTLVTFESGPYVYRGTAFTATAQVTGAGGLSSAVAVTYSGDCTNVTSTNGCTASASYAGDTNHKPSNDNKSITITKANATIAVTPYNVAYNGLAHTATGTAKGVLNESLSGLNLSGTTHTNPGDYPTDPWTFTDATGNYNIASGTVHDSIGYGACSVGAGGVILPPINSDGTSVYNRKGGSTIPVKFNVCGANGAPLTDPTLVFAPTGGALTMTGALRGTITVVNEDANTDIPDAAFTWDGQQWHFNMATMNLNSGFTYTFTINLAYAPESIHFVVGVK